MSPIYRRGERSTERSGLLFRILKTCRWWDGALRSNLPNSKAVLSRFLHAASKWGSESPRPGAQAATDPSIQGVADRPTQDSSGFHLHSPQLCSDVFVHFLRTAVHDLALSEPWKIENSKILFSKYS